MRFQGLGAILVGVDQIASISFRNKPRDHSTVRGMVTSACLGAKKIAGPGLVLYARARIPFSSRRPRANSWVRRTNEQVPGILLSTEFQKRLKSFVCDICAQSESSFFRATFVTPYTKCWPANCVDRLFVMICPARGGEFSSRRVSKFNGKNKEWFSTLSASASFWRGKRIVTAYGSEHGRLLLENCGKECKQHDLTFVI